MEEIWKEIKGYEGKYLVSNLGRVKSNNRGGAIRKIFKNVSGFYVVTLFKNSCARTYYIHRLMYETFVGYPADPNLCYVYFKDDDRTNITLENLECVIMETTDTYDGGRKGRRFPDETKESMKNSRKNQSKEALALAAAKRSETFRKKREMEEQGLEFNDYSGNYGRYRKYFADYHREYYREHKPNRKQYYQDHKDEIREKQRKFYNEHKEEICRKQREKYKEKKMIVEEPKERKNYLEEVKNILLNRLKKK